MANTVPGFVAGGNVNPSRFVNLNSTADHTVTQAGDNVFVFGIAHEGTKDVPIPGASTLAAEAGDPIKIYGEGEGDVLLELGGTVSPGNRLKSDANGKGVAIALTGVSSTDVQHYGAIALEDGVFGDKIRVFVTLGSHRPSPSAP